VTEPLVPIGCAAGLSDTVEGLSMTGAVADVAGRLQAELRQLYGTRFRGLYLFGSYAGGDDDEESDLDFLIVLDDFSSYGTEVDRTGEPVSAISLAHAVSISVVFLRERDWATGDSPFLRNVREEAVAA